MSPLLYPFLCSDAFVYFTYEALDARHVHADRANAVKPLATIDAALLADVAVILAWAICRGVDADVEDMITKQPRAAILSTGTGGDDDATSRIHTGAVFTGEPCAAVRR